MPTHSSEADPATHSAFNDPDHDETDANTPDIGVRGDLAHDDGDYVDRVETLVRVLYTLLFFLIARVIEAAVGVIVFFQLVFSLITNRTPNPAVNAFARRVIEYGYQIGHYVTHNRKKPPFPFDELPDEPEDNRHQ